MRKTFIEWLQTQRYEIGPIGNIAQDILSDTDSRLPRHDQATKEEWLAYLQTAGAVDGAIRAFEKAWGAYQQSEQ